MSGDPVSASPVPPGAPLDLDAIEARVKARKAARTFGEGIQADIIFTNAARMDVPALCAEVRRLRAALEEVRARDAEIARLRELFAEPHFMGAPAMAGGGFDESVVMVSRAWYTRFAALAPTGEPGNG